MDLNFSRSVGIEKFRNYVYGTEFEIITDHKALT